MSYATIMVETSGLRKNFGEVKALAGLDLSVPSGIFGFIGPNGAGKTTLLRILLGLIKADSGQAVVLGLDSLVKSLEIRRRVGVLHEKPSFFPTLWQLLALWPLTESLALSIFLCMCCFRLFYWQATDESQYA